MTRFRLIVNGIIIPLQVVSNMEFGGRQQVIVYESPGTNGGVVLTTGRVNNTITLTGRILLPFKSASERADPNSAFPTPMSTLNDIKAQIQAVRDSGAPVQLDSPITNDDSGQYVIEEFRANIIEGVTSYLPFTLTLQEFRQANIRQASQNLVSFEPGEQFKQVLRDRNLLA